MAKKEVRRPGVSYGINLPEFDVASTSRSLRRGASSRTPILPEATTVPRRGRELRPNLGSMQSGLTPAGLMFSAQTPMTDTASLLARMGEEQNMLGLVGNPMANNPMTSNNIFENRNANNTTPVDTSDRNRRIGLMLAALSDAFAGRDIVGRSLERQRFLQPEEKKLTAAQQNLEAFYKIYNDPNATQEEKRLALSLIGGIGKSKKQLKEDVTKSLVTAANPLTGLPYTKEEIEQQIKLFDEFYPNSNENKVDEPTPTDIFKVGGYTIEGG